MTEIQLRLGLVVGIGHVFGPNEGIGVNVNGLGLHELVPVAVGLTGGGGRIVVFLEVVDKTGGIPFLPTKNPLVFGQKQILQLLNNRWILPINSSLPVDVFVPILVFDGISQNRMGDGIPDPVHKLTVFGIGNFSIVHVEGTHRDILERVVKIKEQILISLTVQEGSLLDIHHAVGRGFEPWAPVFGSNEVPGIPSAAG